MYIKYSTRLKASAKAVTLFFIMIILFIKERRAAIAWAGGPKVVSGHCT